jgi:hypothetical protein
METEETVSQMRESSARKNEELKIKQKETKETFEQIIADTDKARISEEKPQKNKSKLKQCLNKSMKAQKKSNMN